MMVMGSLSTCINRQNMVKIGSAFAALRQFFDFKILGTPPTLRFFYLCAQGEIHNSASNKI